MYGQAPAPPVQSLLQTPPPTHSGNKVLLGNYPTSSSGNVSIAHTWEHSEILYCTPHPVPPTELLRPPPSTSQLLPATDLSRYMHDTLIEIYHVIARALLELQNSCFNFQIGPSKTESYELTQYCIISSSRTLHQHTPSSSLGEATSRGDSPSCVETEPTVRAGLASTTWCHWSSGDGVQYYGGAHHGSMH